MFDSDREFDAYRGSGNFGGTAIHTQSLSQYRGGEWRLWWDFDSYRARFIQRGEVAVLVASIHTELDSYKRGSGDFGETSIPTEFDSQRGGRFIQRGEWRLWC